MVNGSVEDINIADAQHELRWVSSHMSTNSSPVQYWITSDHSCWFSSGTVLSLF